MKELKAIEERFDKIVAEINEKDNSVIDETKRLKRYFGMVKHYVEEVDRDNRALRAYIDIKIKKEN